MTFRIESNTRINKDIVYLLALGTYLVFAILNTSLYACYITAIYKAIILFSITLLILREIWQWKMMSIRVLLFFFACILLMMLTAFRGTGAPNSLLTIIVFTIAASDMDFKKIAQVSYYVILLMLCFIILSSKTGVVEDYVYVMAGRPRHYLGFLYTLQPAGLMMESVMLNLYLNKNKKRNYSILVLMTGGIAIFYYTRARLTFFFEMFMILYDVVVRYKPSLGKVKVLNILEIVSFPFMTCISLYLSLTFKSCSWKLALNNFLSNRLQLAYNSIEKHGIKLWGENISWYGLGLNKSGNLSLTNVWTDYNWVDNAYIQALQLYGIIVCLTLLIMLSVSMYFLVKRKNSYVAFILLIYSLHGFIDTAMLTLFYNVFWLALLTEFVGRPQVLIEQDLSERGSER